MRKITALVVHCTASRCTSTLTPAALDAEHRRRGFDGCGYHYYITKDGTIHPMRPEERAGAHVSGHNANTIGVSYEGGLTASGQPADTRTPEQRAALIELLRKLLLTYPGVRICGHRDFSPDLNGNGTIEPNEYIKMCPCFDASTEYASLLLLDETEVTAPTLPQPDEPEPTPDEEPTFAPEPLKKEVTMKPFWRGTLRVLRVICKFVTWLTGQSGADADDKEKK